MDKNFKFNKNGKWIGLYKLQEEMHELGVELSKLCMVDGKADAYWGDRNLISNIEDELADVHAIIHFFIKENREHLNINKIDERKKKKLKKYYNWKE